jgi:dihydroorotase
VVPGVVPLETIVARLGAGGRAFGIEPFGVGEGATANFCLIDLAHNWLVGEDGFESRSSNSWCLGEELTGRVLTTVANGQIAWRLRSFSLEVA